MKKYLYATLAGGLVMLVAFVIYAFVEMQVIGMEPYMNEALFLTMEQHSLRFTIGIIVLKCLHAFLLAYLHESIPRCHSSLWEKTWRFTLLAWLLVYATGLGMTYISMPVPPALIASWALSGLFQTMMGSLVIIHILYRYPAPDLSCHVQK